MTVLFKVDSFIFGSWDVASHNHLGRKELKYEASNCTGLVSLGDLMVDEHLSVFFFLGFIFV